VAEDIALMKRRLDDLENRIVKIEGLLLSKPKSIEKKVSLKEFILQKNPRNDVEKTLAIAYYYENCEGFSSCNKLDIQKGFRDARESVPTNVGDKIQKNIAKGHMMDAKGEKDGHKAYVLTNSGERFVEDNFRKVAKPTEE